MIHQDPAHPAAVASEINEPKQPVEDMPVSQNGHDAVGEIPTEDILHLQEDVLTSFADPTAAETVPEDLTTAVTPVQRKVSGRYRSAPSYWRLELRIDIDGRRPLRRISGDFYRSTGWTVSYFGSFVLNAPTIRVTATQMLIEGLVDTTWNTSYRKLRLIIARNTTLQPPATAHVQWMTITNQAGATYTCQYESPYFRAVQFEQDYVSGITGGTPFAAYDTAMLPSGGTARVLSVEGAYAEAGIHMQTAGTWNQVPLANAGSDSKWSNAELHAAMETQFSLWRDQPQWKVWLLAAERHEMGAGLLGIMFDQQGRQRQGCAIFHAGVGGTTAEKLRLQLYTYVHELGHCYNLFHSFHKSYMQPPLPNRPAALSWMNYPWYYPGGPNAFWSAFPFQFDNLELLHLRHAFRNNIIIGGNPFGIGAALEDPQAFADKLEDHSGLRLELEAPRPSVALGEPVRIEIKLKLLDMRGKTVHTQLHPNTGAVQLAIRKPSGQVLVYQPLMHACMAIETMPMDAGTPALYESAYIGYGQDGFYFDQVGTYHVRAVYYDLDGSEVLSDILPLRVRAPQSVTDEEVADLFFGEEQGVLLYLEGSDSDRLERGMSAFEEVLNKYCEHPLAIYAQWIKGINETREFKTFDATRKAIKARKPRLPEAQSLLTAVVDASEKGGGVDNIALNATMRKLAAVQKAEGDEKSARTTLNRMVTLFKSKKLGTHVQRHIEQMARAELETLSTVETPSRMPTADPVDSGTPTRSRRN